LYSRQLDGGLEQIATQAAELTELAREVLQEELIRRRLKVEPLEQTVAEPEQRNLVTIRKFRDLPDALLAKGNLDSAGVESFLADDNMVRMDWFISNLLGGVKLLVDEEDEAAANEILDQPIPESFDFEGPEEYQQPRCPKCRSLDVGFEELYKPIAFGSLFVNFPLPVHRKGWICHSCRQTWKEDEAQPDTKSS